MAEGGSKSAENGRTEGASVDSDRGVAAIKPQFLTTKDAFHAFIDKGGKDAAEGTIDSEQSNSNDESCYAAEEPQAKKIKLDDSGRNEDQEEKGEEDKQDKKRARGQNKSRPHVKYHQLEQQRLCPSIVQECASKCFFGDKCKFLHDVEKYLTGKQEDIGPTCYLYETLGKCIYGITCRFAKSHLGAGYKNVINEERVKEQEGKVLVRNSLGKELQLQLRKKKFLFEKSERYLKLLSKSQKNRNEKRKTGAKGETEWGRPGEATTEGGDLGAGTDTAKGPTDEVHAVQTPQETPTEVPRVTIGAITDEDIIKLRPCEKKTIDFRNKLYLAPLTTCGNLPYRRICKRYGADITCGEMAMCTNLLQGQPSEWALMKRHHTEDLFGVQLEGAFPDTMTKCAELLNKSIEVDFVDINVGCPIDLVYRKGGGCGLMTRTNKFEDIVRGMNSVLDVPLTVKIRTGVQEKVNLAHKLIPELRDWGVSLVTLHGRSREQRYTKVADWEYIKQCAKIAQPLPLFGNGDIFSFEDANRALETGVSGIMVARGALVKPWLFTEIKEQRHWDISSSERFDILRDFTNYGLEHWGSDTQGVERTRKFMLEWLSFLCRYIPVGLLERVPQKLNERPPYYLGRDYLETLMASQNVSDWIKISEMLLGPVPPNFTFLPKHKANSYR
ncbi:tRNA-dihydrouridine(47) synthase [NAD(P)(+)]-like [Hyla sarda]|uniref:tRNA-dihydrouridine(47) synthase [NAD(P)(+)]-like n=1 Tax=Hyla sarda TaxID=327740 RepID=UPI0024C2C788|nr:tRNA-dihydrouridine(47) synthase [NAD(P)(+)]-like [Hyla sarda]XP_056375039.1 tRNA-dihydrouridine(47) synthase [NAD(P)(+)]-like [Hyla sarda]